MCADHERVRAVSLEIEQFLGDDASAWHAAAANALLMGPLPERSDDWAQLRAAQSLGTPETGQAHLRSGLDSDIVLVCRFTRFGSDRCITVTIDAAGTSSHEETSC